MTKQPTALQRLVKVLQVNPQRQFGNYAAQLSFYIILATIPLLLALANVIVFLPFSSEQILSVLNQGLPAEVSKVLLPILETYINNTSASAFSVGLMISLWPASNVFNTLQSTMNDVFNVTQRKNALIARLFSYVFTLFLVIAGFIFGSIVIFGKTILEFVQKTFAIDLSLLEMLLDQTPVIAGVVILFVLFAVYQWMPHVKWRPRYALIGSVVALLGVLLISKLFSVYLSFNQSINSNRAIGIFIVVLIWLYYNMMVIVFGGYVTVVAHDYFERSYLEMCHQTETVHQQVTQHDLFKRYYPNKTTQVVLSKLKEEG